MCKSFSHLGVNALYDALKLRSDVFVVEQTCIYPDLDNKDKAHGAYHLLGYEDDKLIAYARLLPPKVSYNNLSFGRVAICSEYRNKGFGKDLMQQILKQCELLWPSQNIDIGAQVYLQKFYESFGFTPISEEYLEDDIAHIDMRLSK